MMETSCSLQKEHQDRISELPDDILLSIISPLTLQEATFTSILSSRWRYLHTYFARLNFPPSKSESNYVNMVNHVVGSHRGTRIKEFKVGLIGHGIKGFEIDLGKWFEFALIKKAKIIHLSVCDGLLPLSNPTLLHGLNCLKELSLHMIHMIDRDFDLLVSNSFALESLSIKSSYIKENVSIVGHSKLKHLNLSNLWLVESIEIRDVVNLVSLKCYQLDHKCVVGLSNIPKLIKLDLEESFCNLRHDELLAQIPSHIRDQLQLLHLSTSMWLASMTPPASERELPADVQQPRSALWAELVNIKHLELVIDMESKSGLGLGYGPKFIHYLDRLLDEECRSLEKLVVKFLWKPHTISKLMEVLETHDDRYYSMDVSQKYLKELEIRGYLGYPLELSWALYLIDNAEALEKLIVVACDISDAIRQEALARARRDFGKIRSSVNVLII